MKTALKIIGGLIALILIAIVTIPMFVDVDKYRPQIVKAADAQMNGSLELGKLSLSLWGKVHVGVDGLNIRDAQGKSVVSVKDASFDLPYLSVISGAPLVTVVMKQPDIAVLKTRDGKLNVMNLMKASAAATPTPNAAANTAATGKVELPSMAVNAHFGVYIENAKVTYKDEALNLSNTIDQLNFRVKDFSLARKTEMELWADLKTQMGTDLHVEGPLKLTAELTPEIVSGEFKSAAVVATFTADDLVIQKGTLFEKKKGVPLNFKFDGALTADSLKLNNATAKFHNAEIVVTGNYGKETGANISFNAKPIDLKSWSELVPMLKEYELEGALGLVGGVTGKPEALQYHAKLGILNFAAKGPNLKAKPLINGEVDVETDKIEKIYIDLKGPGNELVLNAKLVSFAKPQITFSVTSPKGMDLDQWIEFPKTEATTAKAAPTQDEKAGKVAPVDRDAQLDPLRKNEMARAMTIEGNVAIAFLKAKGVRIDDLSAKFQMKNLVIALTPFKMKMDDGLIGGGFTMDAKPTAPQYNMNLTISGFDLQKAVESQMASMKNTVTGKLSATVNGGGASFNPDLAKRRLQMKGEFKLTDASFKSMDVAKMASDAIAGSLSKISSKIPNLQGKNLVPANVDSKYDLVSGSFTIQGGVLDAPNFYAKAAPHRGVDIKGDTKVGLIDESLNAKWELIDIQRVTGADKISVNIAGTTINNPLAKSESDPVTIPISVGCKYTAPCTNYNETAEYLAGVAAGRLSKAAGGIAKSKATDAVKSAIGNKLKSLFGH
jgi:hypothetical protein